MSPKVVQVQPLENFKLRLCFDNGQVKRFDVAPYLEKGIFAEPKISITLSKWSLSLVACNGPMNKTLVPIPCT